MKKKPLVKLQTTPPVEGYDAVLSEMVRILESARGKAVWSLNAVMTSTYWLVGQRIVVHEQKGASKAEYGERLLARLADDLTARFGRGFSDRNLNQMRKFYLQHAEISQTPSVKSRTATGRPKVQTLSVKSADLDLDAAIPVFPLPWSHYVRLLWVGDADARAFYEQEALRGGWTFRQLERQIVTKFYERTLLSKNKGAMLRKGAKAKPADAMSPEEAIKDPFILEFLNLRDEYSESDLEEALIGQLQTFLMELGGDFAFIGRQRRLRIGDEWYRIDLLFFHRRLRCLIVIDLKLGKFTHADAGQMHLYLNYAREHWTIPDENPPVGLILCTHKDQAVAHYSLEGLPNQVLASEYRLALPDEQVLTAELQRSRRRLEDSRARKGRANR